MTKSRVRRSFIAVILDHSLFYSFMLPAIRATTDSFVFRAGADAGAARSLDALPGEVEQLTISPDRP